MAFTALKNPKGFQGGLDLGIGAACPVWVLVDLGQSHSSKPPDFPGVVTEVGPPAVLYLEEGICYKSSRNLGRITLPVGVNPNQTFLDVQDSVETPERPVLNASAHHTLIMGNWSRR